MTKYLTVGQVIRFHDELLHRFGGLPGIRDMNLLQSSLENPKNSFMGIEMYASVFQKAAAYLYSITKNHPFNDGNKRTAFVAALAFLRANQAKIRFKFSDLEPIVVGVANGDISREDLAIFFESGKISKQYKVQKKDF